MPIMEIRKLLDGLIGNLQLILLVLSLLIVIVASVGIMVSIYNSMSERRREIAIMRALGAGRGTIGALILLESILLSILGGVRRLPAGPRTDWPVQLVHRQSHGRAHRPAALRPGGAVT